MWNFLNLVLYRNFSEKNVLQSGLAVMLHRFLAVTQRIITFKCFFQWYAQKPRYGLFPAVSGPCSAKHINWSLTCKFIDHKCITLQASRNSATWHDSLCLLGGWKNSDQPIQAATDVAQHLSQQQALCPWPQSPGLGPCLAHHSYARDDALLYPRQPEILTQGTPTTGK